MDSENRYGTTQLAEWVLRPKKLETFLTSSSEDGKNFDPSEQFFVKTIANDIRYRLTTVGFLSSAKELPSEERLGIALFVGLVGIADDIVDNRDTPEFSDVDSLREYLVKQPYKVNGQGLNIDGRELTVGNLIELTLSKFPDEKQNAVSQFLDDALKAQVDDYKREPGEYSFEEAITYRKNTSEAYARIGCFLSGITDPNAIAKSVALNNTVQALDDAFDCVDDYRNRVMNPLVALAFREGEGDILARNASQMHDTKLGRLFAGRKTINSMPKTRSAYKDYFTEQLNSMEKRPLKSVFRTVGKQLFK